jgi:NAD(P)-dependent dehydrogenase (short-subunit alcohol dehydrogenase family)
MRGLKGKVGIVTGAGSGIGRASARCLAEHGVKVVASDINMVGARETAQMITDAGGEAIAVEADVTDEAAVQAMVATAVDRYGSLQLLHNNAANVGILSRDVELVDTDLDVWEKTLQVNLLGPVLGCKYAIPHMLDAGGGAIVMTSSVSGQRGELSHAAYGTSKAALEGLTLYVATQYGKRNIRCNAVAPGATKTETFNSSATAELKSMCERNLVTPDLADPSQIADAVAFLLSDHSTFVTGQCLNVDGGYNMHYPIYAELISRPLMGEFDYATA